MPKQIDFTDGRKIEYVYDASGVKLQTKHTKPGESPTTTDYFANRISEDGVLKMIRTEEGYAVPNGSNGFNRYYYIKDHLGNNRVVLDESKTVVQTTNYYPFGMTMTENPGAVGPDVQQYKFGGKELDRMFGLDMYDFEARMYSPVLGRFMQPDPMAEKYYSVSPYAYCANNPVRYVDPTGEDYRLTIDQENSRITVSATFYASTQDMTSAQQAVDYWNKQSGDFSYQTKDGDSYTVDFSLTVYEVETDASMGAKETQSVVRGAATADKSGEANAYMVIGDSKMDANKNGVTIGGNLIQVKDSQKAANTGAHEVGHTLGLTHSTSGLMTPSSKDSNRSGNLNIGNLKSMITYPSKGKINSEGGADAGRGTLMYFNSNHSTEQPSSLNSNGKIKKK